MTKTTLFSALVVILILGGLAWFSQAPKNPLPSGSESLTVSEKSYDFGSISMKAGVVSHDFVLTNNSAAPLTVNQIYTSCMCTTAFIKSTQGKVGPFGMPGHGLNRPANVVLAAGETATVEVIFDPAAHGPAGVGSINREVTLAGPAGKWLVLSFRAVVTP